MSSLDHLGFVEPQRICSYLPDQTASLEYRLYRTVTADGYMRLLERGWRRHGRMFFRPQCPTCRECRGIRVPVDTFQPTKSQRRTRGWNKDVSVQLYPATVTTEHVDVYNAYHADMASRRGWPGTPTTLDDYHSSFLAGEYPFAFELQYRREGRLIGVGLVDVLPRGLSSVYFYHAPDWRSQAPGVFSLLCEFDLCRERGIPCLYLGYWIERCPSMTYKSAYGPHELLAEYIEEDEDPEWERPLEPRL
ncbi:MAG TPA: arginyltransferase [Caulifigura sp.]|nr:arginyltransferase [Caulifigura sp.]